MRYTLVFLLVGLLVTYPLLYSMAINNVIWLTLAQRSFGRDSAAVLPIEAALASQITEVAKTNARSSMGLGVLAAFDGDELPALALWQQGKHIEQLVALGQRAQAQGQLDLAMLFFRGAGDAPQEPGWYGIGHICQGVWARLKMLTAENQTRCRHFFKPNNFLLNGDFASASLEGWTAQGQKAKIVVDSGLGVPAIMLDGAGKSGRHGVYQRITLLSGTVVRFSAYVRTHDMAASDFRLLYIGFTKPDGSAAGNALQAAEISLVPNQWRLVERIYTIPATPDAHFLFAPAQVWGATRLDVAQVQLEIVDQP